MSTESVKSSTTPNLPAAQSQKWGCCDWFVKCLEQIKTWACQFFRCLFCCTSSAEPSKKLDPAKVQKKEPEQLAPSKPIEPIKPASSESPPTPSSIDSAQTVAPIQLLSAHKSEITATNPVLIEPPVPVASQPPVLTKAHAFVNLYCAHLTSMAEKAKTVYDQDNIESPPSLNGLHVQIIKLLVKPEDQFFLLHQIGLSQVDVEWRHLINALPEPLQQRIFAELATQNKVSVDAVYLKGNIAKYLHPYYSYWEKLRPVFDTLSKQSSDLSLTPIEQFLQDMLFEIYGPSQQYAVLLKYNETFKKTSQKEQAIILCVLIDFYKESKELESLNKRLEIVDCLLYSLFKGSHFYKEDQWKKDPTSPQIISVCSELLRKAARDLE